MTQYCRYCIYCMTANGNWCESKEKELTDAQIKHTNHCKRFEFTPMDAYDWRRFYQPRQARKVLRAINEITAEQLTFDSVTDCVKEIQNRITA